MTATPRFAYATAELAIVARHLRDSRAEGDPAAVEASKLTSAQAADRLRIAGAIAADWTAYEAGEAPSDPQGPATDAEKRATLADALRGAATRRDRARAALAEWPFLRSLQLGALWALVDAHDPLSHHIGPYLHWESYAAALEALAWWQAREGVGSKRFLVETNAALRRRAAHPEARAA